jgi:hypothetical protein
MKGLLPGFMAALVLMPGFMAALGTGFAFIKLRFIRRITKQTEGFNR